MMLNIYTEIMNLMITCYEMHTQDNNFETHTTFVFYCCLQIWFHTFSSDK